MSREYFSFDRKAEISATSSPSQLWKTLVWCRALGLVLRCSISAGSSSVVATNADRFLKLASTRGCTVSTMVLSATRGLVLFRVIREGIGLTQRLSATGTVRLQAIRMLTLEPERLKNQLATTRKDHRRWKGLFTRDAQAACDFSLSASKFSPFFHRVSVMAAILRASVRRAMVGLMPLASDLW